MDVDTAMQPTEILPFFDGTDVDGLFENILWSLEERKPYYSPLNALIANNAQPEQDSRPDLKYSGTLDHVLQEVAALSSDPTTPTVNDDRWALYPPRIIRAVVDYKIQHPASPEIELLLKEAIDVALSVYSDPTTSASAVGKLRGKINAMGLEALLTIPLNQPSDDTTWNATHPERSQKTVQQLASQTQFSDVLFIALAHGGVAAGMDVYLRYCDYSSSRDSAFYVARLSTQKLKDTQPRLSAGEIDYLRELAKGRRVVVFDEDSCSGTTLDVAHIYFSAHVFPSQGVITVSNLDMRRELTKLGLGEQLETFKDKSSPWQMHSLIEELYNKLPQENITQNKPWTVHPKEYITKLKPSLEKWVHYIHQSS